MPKILLVDDDNDFLQSCELVLVQEGYEIVSASSITKAEKIVAQGGLSLILLDIMMNNPDDGISFAHKLKKDGIEVPVIMLSGASKIIGYEYGKNEMLPCCDFIEKPVNPEILLKKVKSVIEK